MKILISGANGLIGSALVVNFKAQGHEVMRLIRSQKSLKEDEIYWNPEKSLMDLSRLESLDAVVHLAGENIADGRWTAQKKARIRTSRVVGTQFLADGLSQLQSPPKVWASASAIGFYGNRGDEILDETGAPGTGFLADVCREWEAATVSAKDKGMRIAHLRLGIVLSTSGGALAKMLSPFRWGLGGTLGDGKQFMSWIAISDVVRAVEYVLTQSELAGAINLVSPQPVTNREFTETLGKVLHRPTFFTVPKFAINLLLGEMGQAMLLASTRVIPKRLSEAGFEFQYPQLAAALSDLLK